MKAKMKSQLVDASLILLAVAAVLLLGYITYFGFVYQPVLTGILAAWMIGAFLFNLWKNRKMWRLMMDERRNHREEKNKQN